MTEEERYRANSAPMTWADARKLYAEFINAKESAMIRKLPAPDDQIGSGRNVTGPLQIGNDWPGTFFRGDDSGGICDRLRGIARQIATGSCHPAYAKYLNELADTFSRCQIKGDQRGA